jgi:hypothetical protein
VSSGHSARLISSSLVAGRPLSATVQLLYKVLPKQMVWFYLKIIKGHTDTSSNVYENQHWNVKFFVDCSNMVVVALIVAKNTNDLSQHGLHGISESRTMINLSTIKHPGATFPLSTPMWPGSSELTANSAKQFMEAHPDAKEGREYLLRGQDGMDVDDLKDYGPALDIGPFDMRIRCKRGKTAPICRHTRQRRRLPAS